MIEIEMDGTPAGTIVRTESGAQLSCAAATITQVAGKAPRITLVLAGMKGRMKGDSVAYMMDDPATGILKSVARIDFADGSAWEPA